MTSGAGRPFRATAVGDVFVLTGNSKQAAVMIGAKLTGAGAAATAQLVDDNGTVLCDLAAGAGSSDVTPGPIVFIGKVRVDTLTGAGAVVNVWIE